MVLIALISFFDSMTLEDEFSNDEVEPETEIHEYSTYIKLSRMGRLLNSDSELKMMKEKNFICCLDLFLELLIRNCELPGCMNVPKANYYFVSTIPLLRIAHAKLYIIFSFALPVNGIYSMPSTFRRQQLHCYLSIISGKSTSCCIYVSDLSSNFYIL